MHEGVKETNAGDDDRKQEEAAESKFTKPSTGNKSAQEALACSAQ